MNTLILYKTKYGSSKQYAQWAQEDLPGSEIADLDKFDPADLAKYNNLVIVSAIYMGMIQAQKFLLNNWENLKTKKIYLIAVGMLFDDSARKTYELIPEDIRKAIKYTKVPGKLQLDKLNMFESFITKIVMRQKLDIPEMDKNLLAPIINELKQ